MRKSGKYPLLFNFFVNEADSFDLLNLEDAQAPTQWYANTLKFFNPKTLKLYDPSKTTGSMTGVNYTNDKQPSGVFTVIAEHWLNEIEAATRDTLVEQALEVSGILMVCSGSNAI